MPEYSTAPGFDGEIVTTVTDCMNPWIGHFRLDFARQSDITDEDIERITSELGAILTRHHGIPAGWSIERSGQEYMAHSFSMETSAVVTLGSKRGLSGFLESIEHFYEKRSTYYFILKADGSGLGYYRAEDPRLMERLQTEPEDGSCFEVASLSQGESADLYLNLLSSLVRLRKAISSSLPASFHTAWAKLEYELSHALAQMGYSRLGSPWREEMRQSCARCQSILRQFDAQIAKSQMQVASYSIGSIDWEALLTSGFSASVISDLTPQDMRRIAEKMLEAFLAGPFWKELRDATEKILEEKAHMQTVGQNG